MVANAVTRQPGDQVNTPFSRMIVLDWLDGPVSGLAQSADGVACRFELVDLDETDESEVRVFSLAALPEAAFERAVAACSTAEAPHWPVWVPRWQFASPPAERAADAVVQAALDEAAAPDRVVAFRGAFREVLACARLHQGESVDQVDWFARLGLTRHGSRQHA